MYRLLMKIAKEGAPVTVVDAIIVSRNGDGTYNIKFKGGATKSNVRSMTAEAFAPNTSVTVVLPQGRRSHARIMGRGIISTRAPRTVEI